MMQRNSIRIVISVLMPLIIISMLSGCDLPNETENISDVSPSPAAPVQFSFSSVNYALTCDAKAFLGDYLDEYHSFIDAITECNESFTFSSVEAKRRCLAVVCQFPLYTFCTPFDNDYYRVKTQISFKIDSSEFKNHLSVFDNTVNDYISGLIADSNPRNQNLLELYKYISSKTFINSEDYDNIYSFVIEGKGNDEAFAKSLAYFLTLAGFDCLSVKQMSDLNTYHNWVILNLDGNYYNLDPVYENGITSGNGLSYFMMSDAKIYSLGYLSDYSSGEYDNYSTVHYNCTNTDYDSYFSNVSHWKSDGKGSLLLSYGFKETYNVSLNIDSFLPVSG